MRETDLCAAGIRFLESHGYETGEECHDTDGTRIDLAGMKGGTLWIIEAKLELGWKVIDQALKHVGKAQRVSILLPENQRRACHNWRRLLALLPIGVLVSTGKGVLTAQEPSVRPPSPHMDYRSTWKPGRRSGPAGSPGAPKTNPTVLKVERIARNAPDGGAYLRDHWADDDRGLQMAIRAVRDGRCSVDWRGQGKRIRVYPKGAL